MKSLRFKVLRCLNHGSCTGRCKGVKVGVHLITTVNIFVPFLFRKIFDFEIEVL